MKRIKAWLSRILLFLIVVLGVSTPTIHAEEKIKEPVIIGVDSTFAPYAFKEDGEYKGFDVEIIEEIFKRINLDYEFQSIEWQTKESELNSNNIDAIMSGYSITPEREEQVAFSDIYFDGKIGILVKADSDIKTKADLAGKKLATQEGSSQLEAVMREPEFVKSLDGGEVITMGSFNEVLADLESGRVDAIVISESVTRYYFKMNGKADQYRMLEENFGESRVAAGFRKEDAALAGKFNEGLKEIKEDGTYDEIYSNWFAEFSLDDSPKESSEETTEEIKEPVIIGIDSTFAPYAFEEDGEYVGYDIEIVDAVFDRIGLDYEFQPIEWQMKESELNSGNIDAIMSGYSKTPEREKTASFSDTYLDTRSALLVKADSDIKTKEDLAGKKVATQEGSVQLSDIEKDEEFVKSLDEGRVITMSSFNEVLNDLENDRVDAIVISESVTRYYFKMNGQADKYRMLDEDFGAASVAAGFRKDDAALVEKFNEGLKEIKADGTYDKIFSNWFAELATDEEAEETAAAEVKEEKPKRDYLTPLLRGAKTTVKVFLIVLMFSIPLGLIIALLEQNAPKFIKVLIQAYVYIFRGTPLLLQMMVIFFGLPYIGIVIDRMPAALITMIINYAAYLVEIFRGGLNSIPDGQYEALKVLSINRSKGLKHVILPQLWKIVMPSVGNEVISLVKDTSLIYVLGLDELLKAGRALSNQYASMVPFLYVGVIYLIMTGIVTLVLRQIEKKLED